MIWTSEFDININFFLDIKPTAQIDRMEINLGRHYTLPLNLVIYRSFDINSMRASV